MMAIGIPMFLVGLLLALHVVRVVSRLRGSLPSEGVYCPTCSYPAGSETCSECGDRSSPALRQSVVDTTAVLLGSKQLRTWTVFVRIALVLPLLLFAAFVSRTTFGLSGDAFHWFSRVASVLQLASLILLPDSARLAALAKGLLRQRAAIQVPERRANPQPHS